MSQLTVNPINKTHRPVSRPVVGSHCLTAPPWPPIDDVSVHARLHMDATPNGYASVKPLIEFCFAIVLLVPVLPLIGIAWLLVRLASPGPGFYVQTRSGQVGKPYRIIKIRSMHHRIEERSGVQWAKANDPRVFLIGRLMRKTHLDELPQLFNVLLGQMALVGPRPERPEVIRGKGLCDEVPGYDHRLQVKPGVTGLAQIQLPADHDIRGVRHKVAYDLYYIVNRSLWLDIRVCAATLFKAAGVGPFWLRRLFFLPTPEQVAEQFLALVHPPAASGSASLVPA